MRALEPVPASRRGLVEELTTSLAEVPGVVAVVLGGSWARGDARPDSDVDLALYYHDTDPPDVDALRAVATRFDMAGDPVVTNLYEWGPWVNGGAWLHTSAGKVDLLYRSLEHVARVIDAAGRGEHETHFAQQPPYGYFSVTYLAETAHCVVLTDSTGAIAALKQRVVTYPPALRCSLVQSSLWSAEFTLYVARDLASHGDVYGTAGCLTRASSALVQTLFAINHIWFASDKTALAATRGFTQCPEDFAARLTRVLARPGATAAELRDSVRELEALFRACVALAGDLYQPRWPL